MGFPVLQVLEFIKKNRNWIKISCKTLATGTISLVHWGNGILILFSKIWARKSEDQHRLHEPILRSVNNKEQNSIATLFKNS